MMDYLELEQEVGVFEASRRVQDELTQVRYDAATLINASPENLGFSSTTTTAWLSIVSQFNLTRGRILITQHEWGDNLRILKSLTTNTDATIEVLPQLDLTVPDLNKWRERLDDDVSAIFAPMITSIDGYRYPVESIGRLPRPEGCVFVVDAAQALGQTSIDIDALSCDALVATCRKWLRGPRNTALFWIKDSLGDRFSAAEIEPFDASLALRLGLGIAISEAENIGIGKIEKQIRVLKNHAADAARAIDLTVQTGIPSQTGTLCLGIPAEAAAVTQQELTSRGLIVKFPNRKVHEPLAPRPEADTIPLRISPNISNTKEEISKFFENLEAVLKLSQEG
jgi:selenocysteine lyase/cysteine desulfurase